MIADTDSDTDPEMKRESRMGKKKAESFEELLAQTESLVEALEGGALSLDESLKTYEKGIENLRACARLIQQAEEKVKALIEKSAGVFALEDLDAAGLDEEDEEEAEADGEDAPA